MKKILVQALRLCTLKKTILSSTLLYLFILGFVVESKAQPASIQQFFPVYGITLGKTTSSDLKNLGYFPTSYETAHYCEVKGIQFWDENGNHIYDEISIDVGKDEPIPDVWIYKYSFNRSLSYSEWQRLFENLGFSIKVTQPPTRKYYGSISFISAYFTAVSSDGALIFSLAFNDGGKEESFTVNSKNLLTSIRANSRWESPDINPPDNYTQQQNAIGTSKDDTEKWLAEKLFAFVYNADNDVYKYRAKTVEVENCNIIVNAEYRNYSEYLSSEHIIIEIIPITAVLTYLKDKDTYVFKGKLKRRNESEKVYNEVSSSWFELKNVPDDMLERIKKALEHYKKLCGVKDEPF